MQIDYVKITRENQYSWLKESVLTLPMGLTLDKSIPGGVEPGDVIWLSRRKKIPEVRQGSLHRIWTLTLTGRMDQSGQTAGADRRLARRQR